MIKLGICLLVFWGVLIVKIQAETINTRGESFKLGNQILCIDENNNNKFCQEYFEIFEKTNEKYKTMINNIIVPKYLKDDLKYILNFKKLEPSLEIQYSLNSSTKLALFISEDNSSISFSYAY